MGRVISIRRRDPISPELGQVLALIHGAGRMLEDGMSRDEVAQLVARGLRAVWPAQRDDHPRLSHTCPTCEDTGFVRDRRPETYRGAAAVAVTWPCHCARGQMRADLIQRLDEDQSRRRHGRRPSDLTQVGQASVRRAR